MDRSDSLGLLAFVGLAVLLGVAVPAGIALLPLAARPPAGSIAATGVALLAVAFGTVYALRRYGENRVDPPETARFDTADDRE